MSAKNNNLFATSPGFRRGFVIFQVVMIPLGMAAAIEGEKWWSGFPWGMSLYTMVALAMAMGGRALTHWRGRLAVAVLAAMWVAGVLGKGNMAAGLAALAAAHLLLLALLCIRPRWRHVLAAGVAAAAVNAPLFGWLGAQVSPREEVPVFAVYAVLATLLLALAGGAAAARRATAAGVASLVLAGYLFMFARYADTTHLALLASLGAYYTSQLLLAAGAWNLQDRP